MLWPFLVSNSPATYDLNITLLQVLGKFGGANNILAAGITFFVLPVCLLFFVCLALFQVSYLDRLVLYTEETLFNSAMAPEAAAG